MNLEPLHSAATEMPGLLAWVQQSMPDAAGISPDRIWADLGADDGTGLLLPALAGIAAAMTVALTVAIYFQTGYRSYRDMIRHGLAAAIGLTLMAFVIADMRNVALAHLAKISFAKSSAAPASEFDLQWQKTAERAKALAAEMGQAHQG